MRRASGREADLQSDWPNITYVDQRWRNYRWQAPHALLNSLNRAGDFMAKMTKELYTKRPQRQKSVPDKVEDRKTGRPTGYRPGYIDQAFKFCLPRIRRQNHRGAFRNQQRWAEIAGNGTIPSLGTRSGAGVLTRTARLPMRCINGR
jgi:hypothetical protein